ncbi:MAG: hypothetical protein WD118_11305 [Phycisphaeraceae bacterium]
MTKTTRTCPACNEATLTFTARNRKEVERYADYKIDNGNVCDACLVRQREEENAKAAAANAEAGLPDLKGTPKQVAWAETIRAELLGIADNLTHAVNLMRDGDLDGAREAFRIVPMTWRPNDLDFATLGIDTKDSASIAEATLAACHVLREPQDAGWWIDNRGIMFRGLLKELRQPILDALGAAPRQEEVVEEVAVKPADPVTTEVAEVSVDRLRVTVKLPEKREDFRGLVKGLGYRWSPDARVWALAIAPSLGTPEDRAAELMHKLLDAGFIVACQRAEVREKAIAASYEPVYPRWLASMKSGRFEGWVQVVIRDDLDIRHDLERLGGKADFYQSGVWYVRPGNYATLRDFGEIYGFRLTPGAEKALTKAQHADEARLLAEDLPDAPSAEAEGQEPERHVPDDIDPELKDD